MSKEELEALAKDHPRAAPDKSNGEGPGPDAAPDPEPEAEPPRAIRHAPMRPSDPLMVQMCTLASDALFGTLFMRRGWAPLEPKEAERMGNAGAMVAAQYDIHMSPRGVAWYGLAATALSVVWPRYQAARDHQAPDAPEPKPTAAPAAPDAVIDGELPEGYQPPAAGTDTSAPAPDDVT